MADQNIQQDDQAQSQARRKALSNINREMEEKSVMARAAELKLQYVDVDVFPVNPDILVILKPEDAKRGLAMPFFKVGKNLRVAVADPSKPETKEILANLEKAGFVLQIHLASANGILGALRHYESDQYKMKVETKNVVAEEEIHYEKELENLALVKEKLATMPAEEALNMLHVSAIKAGASDIHYQPEENFFVLRFRIDGVLHKAFELGKDVYARLSGQLKYKANMKLNVTNVPQDGRFRFIVNERKIDVRVSSIPTEYGESFVCRILDSGKNFGSFEELGFNARSLEILKNASELNQGMVLVTGPTSSGKTTTLYVLLNNFNTPEVKIITLEDPIEYHLAGITQSQIEEKSGYNFADGLRSILRQDPDVVMIGEIRDKETAEVAAQAALTGHVLLSTLHTNSAVETIPRLITIGLPQFVLAPALSVVVAQRLLRRLCTCAVDRQVTAKEKEIIEKALVEIKAADQSIAAQTPEKIKQAKGCAECNMTGFRGQMVVSEVLAVDDKLKAAILEGKPAAELFAIARTSGMLSMMEDAILKVIAGSTTLEEVHRVINA
ncbi:type II/IV secretion system protein [Candidatus Peregrinibacteria bacterium]|nr:type II/IV secretion system protein [Candidatus Peregrinibacteria bacterium]